MAHTAAFRRLIFILQKARRANLEAEGLPAPLSSEEHRKNRRRFIKTTAAAGIAGALLTAGLPGSLRQAQASQASQKTRIAVIGGGLAGLNAAYQLKKAGIHADVYEASSRLGGRVFSQTGTVGEGLITEYGGELINTNHEDMLALVQEFGLTLFNRREDAASVGSPTSAYYFNGKNWSEGELVELLRAIVAQISSDAALIDDNWDKYASKFDRLSVRDYFDKHASLISQPFIRTLFENAIRVEYGVEPSESTSLQLLFLLPSVEGNHVELLSDSDEMFSIQEGGTQLINGFANALAGQIHTRMALTHLETKGKKGYKLKFKHGNDIEADYVILALPFSVLRHVEIDAPLPGKLKRFIRQVDLGWNEKLLAGYRDRAWRDADGFSLEAWTDQGFSLVWDGTQRQTDHLDGALTYFLSGDEVRALNNWPGGVDAAGPVFTQRLAHFIPALRASATGKYVRTGWTRNPYIRGAYVNYRPGQLTAFGNYFWIESENPTERQTVHVGNLVFAGEHLSDEYYGFMNGGAQTGRLAAQFLQETLDKKG